MKWISQDGAGWLKNLYGVGCGGRSMNPGFWDAPWAAILSPTGAWGGEVRGKEMDFCPPRNNNLRH